MRKWVIEALRIYGRVVAIDDVKDFPRVKGQFFIHHWITGVALSMLGDYLKHKERKKEKIRRLL